MTLNARMTDSAENDKTGMLDRRARTKRIGKQLRALYDEVAQEDVPDEFLRLLQDADRSATEAQAGSQPPERANSATSREES
jgi:hypothetical protein